MGISRKEKNKSSFTQIRKTSILDGSTIMSRLFITRKSQKSDQTVFDTFGISTPAFLKRNKGEASKLGGSFALLPQVSLCFGSFP